MKIVHEPGKELDEIATAHCVCVPTMGALHEGHLILIRHAATLGNPVVVTIFVNPMQFGPGEDLDRYPRPLERDCDLCREAGAAFVFAPTVDLIYPQGLRTAQAQPITLPPVAREPGLEDARRPTHFRGVCQVVTRLFEIINPQTAVFGEKDYQQLLVIRALVESSGSSLRIVGRPIVRADDGLALSSRNAYLSPTQRRRALGLPRALQAAAEDKGNGCPAGAERAMRSVLIAHQLKVDYAVIRDSQSLLPVVSYDRPTRALVAARVGNVRLIDNATVGI